MTHNDITTPDEQEIDISKCRVHRIGPHRAKCMMNDKHCRYALPYGNFCGHPLVDQIADADMGIPSRKNPAPST